MKKFSLYIHIPFCARKCLYCDFHYAPAPLDVQEGYVRLLCREIRAWGSIFSGSHRLSTVFIGGGTPTCLSAGQLQRIGEAVRESFDCHGLIEYTAEANPGTVTEAHIAAFRDMGVERISLGLQSAQDQELQALGRIHGYDDFLKTFDRLREAGFDNINIDLMAAVPGQTEESYADTLQKVAALAPEHISAYSLIVEPGTPFFALQEQGQLLCPDEEADRRMYEYTDRFLSGHGYHRYEISNYAREGKECRHNIQYWTGGEYLGLGENAASYIRGTSLTHGIQGSDGRAFSRQEEPDALWWRFQVPAEAGRYQEYVAGLERMEPDLILGKEGLLEEVTAIGRQEQMEEFMFLGLRMMRGISMSQFQEKFGQDIRQPYGDVIRKHQQNGLIKTAPDGDHLVLTKRGIDISNTVLADFLFTR